MPWISNTQHHLIVIIIQVYVAKFRWWRLRYVTFTIIICCTYVPSTFYYYGSVVILLSLEMLTLWNWMGWMIVWCAGMVGWLSDWLSVCLGLLAVFTAVETACNILLKIIMKKNLKILYLKAFVLRASLWISYSCGTNL